MVAAVRTVNLVGHRQSDNGACGGTFLANAGMSRAMNQALGRQFQYALFKSADQMQVAEERIEESWIWLLPSPGRSPVIPPTQMPVIAANIQSLWLFLCAYYSQSPFSRCSGYMSSDRTCNLCGLPASENPRIPSHLNYFTHLK